jgi:hypothetical protein
MLHNFTSNAPETFWKLQFINCLWQMKLFCCGFPESFSIFLHHFPTRWCTSTFWCHCVHCCGWRVHQHILVPLCTLLWVTELAVDDQLIGPHKSWLIHGLTLLGVHQTHHAQQEGWSLSVVMFCGQQKRDIKAVKRARTTVSFVLSGMGIASGQRVRQYI